MALPSGLLIDVYKCHDSRHSLGISSKHNKGLVIGQGIPHIHSGYEGELILKLCRSQTNKTAILVPIQYDGKYTMFGGNFGFTGDRRFLLAVRDIYGKYNMFYGAIPIHDIIGD